MFTVWRSWPGFFNDFIDRLDADWAHSYIGAFSAASAGWALFSGDWTAVAFAAVMVALAVARHKALSHFILQVAIRVARTVDRVSPDGHQHLHNEVPQYTHVRLRYLLYRFSLPLFTSRQSLLPCGTTLISDSTAGFSPWPVLD